MATQDKTSEQSTPVLPIPSAANIKPDMEQVVDVQGVKVKKGIRVVASKSNKEYWIRPCSLEEIPSLIKHIKKIEANINNTASPADILIANDGAILTEMAEVIKMGIATDSPEITTAGIKKEFTLGDFPAVYKVVLDINDFLAGMRKVYQQ